MSKENLKIVCVLYDDPVDGYPPKYARADIPKLSNYPDGQTLPSPNAIDFSPGTSSDVFLVNLGCDMWIYKQQSIMILL